MYTLILPVVPVVPRIQLGFSAIGGFITVGFLALFLCGRMKGSFKENCQLVSKLCYDSMVDTAPLVGLLLTLSMLNQVVTYVSPYFKAILGNVTPKNELTVCVIFAVLLFMDLFRGSMTLVGHGAATLSMLPNVASFSVPFLYGVFAIPAITVNIGSCIIQSWVTWGLAYTKIESRDFLKLSIPDSYLTGVIQYIAISILLSGFEAAWFIQDLM